MAEERLIDDDKDRKMRTAKTNLLLMRRPKRKSLPKK